MENWACVFVLVAAAVLPFALAPDDSTRKRIYLPLSSLPALAMLVMYMLGFNAYGFFMVGFIFVLPVSLTLTVIGVVLIARARSREVARQGLTLGTLLASIPLLLFTGAIIWTIYTDARAGR